MIYQIQLNLFITFFKIHFSYLKVAGIVGNDPTTHVLTVRHSTN